MRVFTQVVNNISSAERDSYTLLSRLAVNELVTDLENYLGVSLSYRTTRRVISI
ncbi:MAG: hypothetical protein JJP05_06585 [cyanobacterium endosymbiont of Rhopalodia gibba]